MNKTRKVTFFFKNQLKSNTLYWTTCKDKKSQGQRSDAPDNGCEKRG